MTELSTTILALALARTRMTRAERLLELADELDGWSTNYRLAALRASRSVLPGSADFSRSHYETADMLDAVVANVRAMAEAGK